jgi:outer membrane usher protein
MPARSTSRFVLSRRDDSTILTAKWLRQAGIAFLFMAILPRLVAASEAAAKSGSEAAIPSGSEAANPSTSETALDATTEAAFEAASDSNVDQKLLLEVWINGRSTGKIGEFILRRSRLMARPDELHDLGFRVPDSLASRPGTLVALADLHGLTWTIDQKNQILRVTAADSALVPTVFQPGGSEASSGRRTIESGTGMTLNYDVAGTFASGQNGGTGSVDLRSFAPWGIVSSDWLGFAGNASGSTGATKATRLDSAFTFADVNSLRRYTLGDFITSGLAWSRPFHIEGAQTRSDFSMRPDLITFPLPTLTGSAAVPSTVQVLVNGNVVASNQVDPGPFEIPQLPVISGAGTITMTVTNAMGQQVSVTQPFYGGATLLAPGLQTYSVQTGLVRRNWGAASNDYGKMAGTAFYRRGLTQKFTVEAAAEGTPGAFMAGAGGAAVVGKLGILNFDMAASGASGQLGELYSVGAQHIGTKFSLGGSAILANRNYRDVASMNGSGVPRKQLNAFTGLFLRHIGTAGLAYAEIDEDASPTAVQALGAQAQHSHVVTANYSMQIHRISFYVNEFRDLDSSGSSSLQVGFTIPLGRRSSASLSGSSTGSGQAQVQQSAVRVGDWGYQGYVSEGNGSHEFGQVQYKSPVGMFIAGVDQAGSQTTVRVESQAAVSLVDKGLFPSNTIYDSFAIVDTAPVQHVHVYQENRDVGTTDKEGRLLVPDMRAFDVNQLGIEPTDVPADATLSNDKRVVRPQDRSGVVIRFPIQFSHAALLQLVDAAGLPLPLGSSVTLRATGAVVPVGYDGNAYVEGLSPRNELAVELPNGHHCTASFDYKPVSGDIPSIGPLRCLEKKP